MLNQLRLGRKEQIALWSIIGFAFLLRVYKLNEPIWFDEIMTLIHYVRLPVDKLIADYSSFNNHLFYSLQAKAAVSLFGEAPWALRLPALIFGVASVWAVWRMARPALGPAQALLAAALLAVSYHHIWFSQNARGYTELMFWCLASLIVFVEAVGSKSWKAWGGFGLLLAAAMYTHLTAAFFIMALGLVYAAMLVAAWFRLPMPAGLALPEDRPRQLAPLAGFVFGGVVTLLLCAPALPQMNSLVGSVDDTSEVDLMQEYQNPLWTMLEGLRTMGGDSALMMVAAPIAGLVILVGFIGMLKKAPVVALTGALHVVLTLAALIAVNMRIWPRFFFTDFAFAFLFLAHGAFVITSWVGQQAAKLNLRALTAERLFLASVVVMLAGSAVLAAKNYAFPKQNFPAAVELVGDAPASAVAAVGLAGEVYDPYLRTGWRHVLTKADLAAVTPHQGKRWAVVIFPSRTEREQAEVFQEIERDFTLARIFPGTLGDGEVLVYASK